MKASEAVALLQSLIAKHGDLELQLFHDSSHKHSVLREDHFEYFAGSEHSKLNSPVLFINV